MPLDYTDLREMKKRRDVDGLVNILETGDIKECREAICMLGELRTKKAINPLIGFLETDDVQIRSNAAWALGQIGHAKAVLPLIGLMNDPIENIRINAAWSLGRIGDKRALSILRSALKNGSTELRKHAMEAISRIESNGNEKWRNDQESDISDIVDIPLIKIEVPSNIECKYISRVEDDDSQTDYENLSGFSRDVLLRDTTDPLFEDKRQIVLGLSDKSNGLVSVDVIFRYKDNVNGETKSSSVWLQMSSTSETNGSHKTEREIEKIDHRPKDLHRKNSDSARRKAKIKHSVKQKPVDDLPDETGFDQIDGQPSETDDAEIEDLSAGKIIKRKFKSRRERRTEIVEERTPEVDQNSDQFLETEYQKLPDQPEPEFMEVKPEPEAIEIKPEPKPKETKPEPKPIEIKPEPKPREVKPEPKPKEIKPETKPEDKKPEIKIIEIKPLKETKPEIKVIEIKPESKPLETKPEPKPMEVKPDVIKGAPEIKPVQPQISAIGKAPVVPMPDVNVNSAVQLLSDIGMSGMTNAASTVTQLSGEEAESQHALLRTIPIDELKDEIIGLSESVVMISVGLHGIGGTGEVKGEMQLYISSENALEVANDLLCNSPEAAIKEFNDDIISTLKETANIFGGQYISAVSEYIGVPLTLKTPSFITENSTKLAESILKDSADKVEFALATNLSLGNNRTGRLIMLVDPKSFDIIIQKLF